MRHSGPCGLLALVATKVHQDARMKIAQCGCMMRRSGRTALMFVESPQQDRGS